MIASSQIANLAHELVETNVVYFVSDIGYVNVELLSRNLKSRLEAWFNDNFHEDCEEEDADREELLEIWTSVFFDTLGKCKGEMDQEDVWRGYKFAENVTKWCSAASLFSHMKRDTEGECEDCNDE
jgi:hypothetical protein